VVVAVFAEDAVDVVVPTPDVSAFDGAVSKPDDGVYATLVVVAFEPAEEEPEDANDDEAPGPEPPEDALV
jgi:hypothetical protein